jgi:hypothetical protein
VERWCFSTKHYNEKPGRSKKEDTYIGNKYEIIVEMKLEGANRIVTLMVDTGSQISLIKADALE